MTTSARRHRLHTTMGWLLLFAAQACATDTTPSAPTSLTAQPTAQQDTDRPAAARSVCARFAQDALTLDSTQDHGPSDARVRAATRHGTPTLSAQLRGEGRDHTWDNLLAHRARNDITTLVADDPHPSHPGPGNTAPYGAAVLARRVATSADGWHQPLPDVAVYCTTTDTPDGMRIAAVTLSDTTHTSPGGGPARTDGP